MVDAFRPVIAGVFRRVVAEVRVPSTEILSRRQEFAAVVRKDLGVEATALFPAAEELLPNADGFDEALRLARFVIVDPPPGESAGAFALELMERYSNHRVVAYPEPRPVRPPVIAADRYRKQQRYLDSAPKGIDAAGVWPRADGGGVAGADGSGVRIVDIEQGWTLEHEDLKCAWIRPLPDEINQAFFGHGTSVLGILVAVDNEIGGIGIAPNAEVYLANQYAVDGTTGKLVYNTAQAIWRVVLSGVLRRGDILLIEAQFRDAELGLLPVETERCVAELIRCLTRSMDIVVVEPAGNGGRNLDDVTIGSTNPFNEEAIRSDAILVGAAKSKNRTRVWDSNFGSRVDCFAWGDHITTCGDGEHGTGSTDYRTTFGGTSGAAAIIAGAAALSQCIARTKLGTTFSVSQIRSALTAPGVSTEPFSSADNLGKMPNLVRIAERASGKL